MKGYVWGAGAALAMMLAAACGSSGGSGGPAPTAPGPTTLSAPAPESPAADAQLDTLRPTLTVRNSPAGGSGARTYEFQISDRTDFTTTLAAQAGVPEHTAGTTSFTPAADLPAATRVYWRARLHQASSASPWSSTAQFRTKVVGYNRTGELFDPLVNGETIGTRVGSTTPMGARGLRVDNAGSWIRYQLASTLTSGEISVEVEGLQPNNPGAKARIFSMMDGGNLLYGNRFLFNVQYRGVSGNPDNAISFKVVMGDEIFQYEPDFAGRAAGIRTLNPNTTYLWTATWGTTFRLIVREGGATGPIVYEQSMPTGGSYNPSPHTVYLGANDAGFESGSYGGAIYRNLWVGSRPRPAGLGSGLQAP
ncbi:MAG TPA: hypothetical protein VM364_04570 [Vicinamibacterales bacterium]|nr:hypothetical protein [Vicinamibacterales bacterium]